MSKKIALILCMLLTACLLGACSTTVTPVYLLRHAEKAAGADPGLTPQGQQRAEELVRVLKHVPVAAVYSTNTNRTRQTAQPLAADKGLTVIPYTDASVAGTVLSQQEEQVVVVVGHSDTVPGLITAFGGTPPYLIIPGTEFDNLILLIVKQEKRFGASSVRRATVLHMKYGEASE